MKENNKLIAEFMGYEIVLGDYCDPYPSDIEVEGLPMYEYMFKDWESLMPVVEKIEGIVNDFKDGYETFNSVPFGVRIERTSCEIIVDNDVDRKRKMKSAFPFKEKTCDTKIDAVYEAVLEFVKWYKYDAK